MRIDRIGVLGLGRMGGRIAAKLLDAGHPVTVWNRNLERARPLEELGATVAGTPAEVAEQSEVLLSSLADDAAVAEVVLGRHGAVNGLQEDAVVVELSTVSPDKTRRIAEEVREAGGEMLDAALSGSTSAVEQGTVMALVGGDAEVLERCRGVLAVFCDRIVHVGFNGAGASAKLAFNLLLAVEMQALAESIVLADALGLERERLFEALEKSSVVADGLKPKLENVRRDDYPPAFSARLMNKDLGLVREQALRHGVPLLLTEAAAAVFAEVAAGERAEDDFSIVIRRALTFREADDVRLTTRTTRK
jgi:3-hydroxyisobutyrate dehydrogenase-like beta-hydroxyacid dehydrogenase